MYIDPSGTPVAIWVVIECTPALIKNAKFTNLSPLLETSGL
ncbi:hypothetical protein [Acetobacterium bakii]|nr:hypothetical protein [Acetobacterium bakii]